jgi:Zn-dependent peptidase ImmA (M78 family)
VNGNDSDERQRFTACHEAAHIELGLPSEHAELPWWSYAKRSPNEILCDAFAAKLLMPYKLFKPLVDKAEISRHRPRQESDKSSRRSNDGTGGGTPHCIRKPPL